jgi:hypothetical protein
MLRMEPVTFQNEGLAFERLFGLLKKVSIGNTL